MLTCCNCGLKCDSRSRLLIHSSVCQYHDQDADNYSISSFASSENLLVLSPVTDEQARVAAEVEEIIEGTPGNIFIIAVQDGEIATDNITSSQPQTPSNSFVFAPTQTGTPTPSDVLGNVNVSGNISSPQTPSNRFVVADQSSGTPTPSDVLGNICVSSNISSPQTPSNRFVVADQSSGTPTPSDVLGNICVSSNISSPQTPSNRFVVADQSSGTPTPSDVLGNICVSSNISSPQTPSNRFVVADQSSGTPTPSDVLGNVITPVRTIGGQWIMSRTPKGVNQVVHWTQNKFEDSSSTEEPVRRAKKRLWKDTDMGITENPQTTMNLPTPSICPYCGLKRNNSKNFTRHLKSQHADQDPVKVLLKLSKSGSSRREIQKITDCLRKLGRHKYMTKYGSDISLPAKRSKKKDTVLVTCQFCLGGYSSEGFRHHWRSCPQRPASHLETNKPFSESVIEKRAPESSRQFCSVLPSSSLMHDDRLITAQNMILKSMHMTDVGKQALNDILIVKFAAERLPGVQHDAGKLDYFRQGIRDLSKLLSKIKELDPTITNLTDCFDCSKFPVIMKAVHCISETDFIAGTVKKTSFNNRLRTPLGSCCNILLSEARINLKGNEREERVSELKHFMDELESKWPKQFGTLAENQRKENRHGKVINCADPDDISLVFNKCDKELPEAIKMLKKSPNCKNYDHLMKIIALSMFTTSRRRSCDLQKLTTSDFLALQKNQELCVKVGHTLQLSDELQKRISSLYCIFSCGKDQLPTAILLTENMKSGIECILETQKKFDIQSKRIFVRLEKEHRPWKVDLALEWAKKVIPLKDPKNFGIRGIRHLTGTVGQLLTEQDPKIESIFREGLSHSEHVSKRYYRGNLASRLIQGYGLPLMENMKSKSKSKPTCTVTSSQVADGEQITAQLPSTLEIISNEKSSTLTSSQFDRPLIDSNEKSILSPVSDEYIPNTSSEEDWQLEMCSEVEASKPTSLHDKTKVVRRKWSNEEDYAIIRQFSQLIKMEKRISGDEIRLAQENEPSLRDRTAAQIRARLSLIRLKSCLTGDKLSKLIYKLKSPEAKTYGKCGTKKGN